MPTEPLRLLILGAHPDDAEFYAGGLVTIYRKLGHAVRMISLTDGSAGHHVHGRRELADIRRREAAASAKVTGAVYDVWDNPDGALQPTLELRERVIGEIRRFQPDLVLTHRSNDYHPDHRAVGQVVQDASFLVRVPLVVPDVPALKRDPVIAFMTDLFTKPNPMTANVILDVEEQIDSILAMLASHHSQVFEWLPWLDGALDQVPSDHSQRMACLRQWFRKECRPRVERYRNALVDAYGAEHAQRVEFAEIFEISEYGSPLDAKARERLFGFVA
jgi:LmbE family N-acetylglucosaminyl deacetylase